MKDFPPQSCAVLLPSITLTLLFFAQLIEKALKDHDQKFNQLYPVVEKLNEEYLKNRHPRD
jgi:molybdopterin converting factor small subunit